MRGRVQQRNGGNATTKTEGSRSPDIKRFSNVADTEPTIFALSTAPGRAAIAVIRCSGRSCLNIYTALCPESKPPRPRYAALRTLHDPHAPARDPRVLDSGALVLYFPAPQTATGEDVLELHVHGGPATVKAILAAVSKLSTTASPIRYAEPGEFTRRAFYSGRLDLTQVEALGDTLSAETEQQRRLAVRGISSVLTGRYEAWRHLLLQARGELEALIDFSEDQHFDESSAQLIGSVARQIRLLRRQVDASIRNASKGELLRRGIGVALLGAPNAGKSSLLNRIAGREAAIVSPQPGTTRDVVEINVDIGGFFCRFGDLAGLRASAEGAAGAAIGEVEEEGIRRAKARVLAADLVVVVIALEIDNGGEARPAVSDEVLSTLKRCDPVRQRIVLALNKVDLCRGLLSHSSSGLRSLAQTVACSHPGLASLLDPASECVTGWHPISCSPATDPPVGPSDDDEDPGGIQALLAGIARALHSLTVADAIPGIAASAPFEESLGASERQARLLSECRARLGDFLGDGDDGDGDDGNAEGDVDVVLAAEGLRAAAGCLAKITGRGEAGDVEEVLGVVFERFCVGK